MAGDASLAFRLACAESLGLELKYYDVPQVFTCSEGETVVDDLTLKSTSSSAKTANMFFDIIRNVPCEYDMAGISELLALDETEVRVNYILCLFTMMFPHAGPVAGRSAACPQTASQAMRKHNAPGCCGVDGYKHRERRAPL